MPQIRVLSDDLIGKIAAGEVVERPASVIKELVENSLDAGAREISVHIKEGGKKEIIVIDDGCGMTETDARLSILRHATSKILTADDLNTIHTLGFRGEAIPSIAAVSRLTIETMPRVIAPARRQFGGRSVSEGGFLAALGTGSAIPHTTLSGFKLVVAGGVLIESGDYGCPAGTKVCVADLFFNTPARKKFLRGDKTEEGHVADVVGRLALAFPDVRFKLYADEKEKLACLSVGDARARLAEVFPFLEKGGEGGFATEFNEQGNGISVHGFLGEPATSRSVAQGVYLFVNKRFVKDRILNHAVADGYRSLLPHGSYPFAVVMLDVDPTRVDVNVHPTKQEVRFDNSGAVHNFVASAVRKAVGKFNKFNEFSKFNKFSEFSPKVEGVITPAKGWSASGGSDKGEAWQSSEGNGIASSPAGTRNDMQGVTNAPTNSFSSLRPIGQLARSYIVCEGEGEKLVVIDQHAAHERIGFEKLLAERHANRIEQQRLLIPEQVELPPKEAACISEYLETLSSLGLEVEPFGGKTFVVKAVPALLSDIDTKSLILSLAAELSDIGHTASAEEMTEHILKTFACHHQVRAHHTLNIEEMQALLSDMDKWPNTSVCPHGRPTFIEFSPEEIGKWFKRN